MQLNALLLDLKKFDHANSEALRKIMKKHEKRTALMLSSTPRLPPPSTPGFESISPTTMTSHPLFVTLLREGTAPGGAMLHPGMMGPVAGAESKLMKHGLSLPHLLVVVLTETLLPVIPSIDDYSCMICFSLAYIPIRLQCRHLFCVRCLSKMQRQGKENCPLCRAPTVLHANRENVDTALQQFMLTWFPAEARAKDKANREEKAREEAIELGYGEDGAKSCIVM
ncbi:hypothetical protein DL93DRAFT_2089810 [Clavulina sp. PMI_390]|nr:hypothetical protein DL93DRAFT_2089810 [Clavulina sp. PMI_390]